MERESLAAALVERWLPKGVIRRHVQVNDRNRQGPGQWRAALRPAHRRAAPATAMEGRFSRSSPSTTWPDGPAGPRAAPPSATSAAIVRSDGRTRIEIFAHQGKIRSVRSGPVDAAPAVSASGLLGGDASTEAPAGVRAARRAIETEKGRSRGFGGAAELDGGRSGFDKNRPPPAMRDNIAPAGAASARGLRAASRSYPRRRGEPPHYRPISSDNYVTADSRIGTMQGL